MILKQMRELGMKQRVFGSHRTLGDQLVALAGPAAEGYQAVYPYDPNMPIPLGWLLSRVTRRSTTRSQTTSLLSPMTRCRCCCRPSVPRA